MTRSRLLLGVAAVLAGAAVLFVGLGAAFNPVLAVVAGPFAVAAYFIWADATGRLQGRIRRRLVDRAAADADRRSGRAGREQPPPWQSVEEAAEAMDRQEALATLDLRPGADQGAIRRAYRDRVKAVHPDTDGGDEDEFRRVRAAYERLGAPGRGKG